MDREIASLTFVKRIDRAGTVGARVGAIKASLYLNMVMTSQR